MNALVIGVRRQGKSTLSLAVAQSQSPTTVIFDPNEQFRNYPKIGEDQMDEWLRKTDDGDRRVVRVVPEGDIGGCFDALADVLWGWEDLTFIIDEASTVQTYNTVHPKLERILRRAHASFHTIQTSHRATDFHRLSRAIAISDVFAFRTVQTGDIERMGKEFDSRLVAILPTLGLYEVAHWWLEPGGEFALSVWRDSSQWYIDIGRGSDGKIEGASKDATQRLFLPSGNVRAANDPTLLRIKNAKPKSE